MAEPLEFFVRFIPFFAYSTITFSDLGLRNEPFWIPAFGSRAGAFPWQWKMKTRGGLLLKRGVLAAFGPVDFWLVEFLEMRVGERAQLPLFGLFGVLGNPKKLMASLWLPKVFCFRLRRIQNWSELRGTKILRNWQHCNPWHPNHSN